MTFLSRGQYFSLTTAEVIVILVQIYYQYSVEVIPTAIRGSQPMPCLSVRSVVREREIIMVLDVWMYIQRVKHHFDPKRETSLDLFRH